MLAFSLSLLALAAGVYLLVTVKQNYLGKIFELLAGLIIALSLVAVVTSGVKSFMPCQGGRCHAGKTECQEENKMSCEGNRATACNLPVCKMEGDSCVLDKSSCEKMLGVAASDSLFSQRGKYILSQEECKSMCNTMATTGKSCCRMDSKPGTCDTSSKTKKCCKQ